jgi:two-component system phosphate regulon sensor histidine kinase PhoR
MAARMRTRLFLAWLVPILASVIVGDVSLSGALDRILTARIRDDLLARLSLCERDAAAAADATESAGWIALAQDLGRRAGARVTLIARDGVVLGDSEVAPADLAHLENHAARPEVRTALAGGQGASIRYSSTLRERMMYAAIPFRRGAAVWGVARIAMPLDEVDRAVGRLRRALLISSGLALLAATLTSLGVAHWISGGLRRLTAMARRMAAGDLAARTRPRGRDEVAELGRALDTLAASLARSLADVRGQRDLMQGILTGMQEGVLLVDGGGRVALVNPALREMLLLGADAVGRPLLEVVRHGALKELLDGAGGAGRATGEIEVLGVRPRRMLVHATTLAGTPPGLGAVFVDVTDIRRLETVRRDFVANVSHELRTPITAVRTAAETLRAGAAGDPEAAGQFLEMIERNAARLQHLVDDLLDLSRIESREYHPRLEAVAVSEAVERVLALLREPAARKRLRLAAALPADLPPVRADRRALDQVLSNLVDNAVKYCPEGAAITVRGAAAGDLVWIAVEDTGPGIEERHLPRLFERFYRVDAGRSREVGGTGLGLSIVKHLVEAMHGTVDVTSTPGRGSVFTVTLERARAGGDQNR